MTVAETVAAIQRADLWALIAAVAVSLGGSILIFGFRRRLMSRTSRHLLINVLACIALLGTVGLAIASYEEASTILVARALRPLAVANAKYLGNPDQVAKTEARTRAFAIVGNMPVDPIQFSCHYPGWSVPGVSMLAILVGAAIVRRRTTQ
jgi:hypothetical protein